MKSARCDRPVYSRAATVLAFSCALASCAHYPTNAPLEGVDTASGYRIRAPIHDGTSHELLFVVTFSGGGTRSAAFAYGVLAALNDIEVEFDGGRRRLANEIDGISSVSAGSVTAAYFGLHGPSTFDTFPERFLYRNVQGALTRRFLAPWNWVRLMSPNFGRSDFMAEYFDKMLFDGKTYADLLDSPAVIINATDIDAGTQFAFDQDQFDLLCSDLASFPIARAVAASSAVPLALSPVTLLNYPNRQCHYELPAWAAADLPSGEVSSRRYQEGRRIRHYVQHEDMRFVHLVDGGLADNLGLRALYDKTTSAGGFVPALELTGFTSFRRILHIVVNAQKERSADGASDERVPGPIRTVVDATNMTLDRYGFETVEIVKRDLGIWMEELKRFRCMPDAVRAWTSSCDDSQSYFVELNFAQHPDPVEREYLENLPTSFRLDRPAVDRVIAAAKTLLEESATFRAFLRDLAALDHRCDEC